MTFYDAGRVCRKTVGADAGKLCVTLAKPDKGMVEVVGPNLKKSKVNISHLEPLPNTVKLGKTASQKDAAEILKKEGLIL